MELGVNAWVWTSPVTTNELQSLAPKVAGMGFDRIEIPLEDLDDLDHERGAAIIKDHGLGVSACVAMGPDRDLVHPRRIHPRLRHGIHPRCHPDHPKAWGDQSGWPDLFDGWTHLAIHA